MTFVLINGILNRVMIHELGILASTVALLVVLPYLLSPLQMVLGQYSDHHPILGYRRTPYILLGAVLCVGGALLTPHAAIQLATPFGFILAVLAFGAWGFGFNMAVVGYLSLASDLSDEKRRSQTIAIMWFMMITGVIVTAIVSSRALEPYSFERMIGVFQTVGLIALGLTIIGLFGLEPRVAAGQAFAGAARVAPLDAIRTVINNSQVRIFFVYLILLLAAILGQDVLLEPFGAQVFGMSVRETTQLTAIWGGATLVALLAYGLALSRWLSKKRGAQIGAIVATFGLLLIAGSALIDQQSLFIPGVALLGFGTGISTSANLALMLDMTTGAQVGLFIGAWGIADSLARGAGMLLGGVVRDLVTTFSGNVGAGYITVFLIEAAMLAGSLVLLRSIQVEAFRQSQPSLTELAAMAGDA
jgi:BCD family chlorophyll transporter-like MFS transporter